MTSSVARWMVERAEHYANHQMQVVLGRAESPLEGLMAASLLLAIGAERLEAQHRIPPYRADLLVDGWLVVEVDGYRYHYLHREDVLSDRRRDRWVARQGFRVIRFVGTEVWNDLEDCVQEVLAIADTRGPQGDRRHKPAELPVRAT